MTLTRTRCVMTFTGYPHCSASLGSDTGEHIRRAMDSQDSPPVDLGREILGLEIPRRSSGGAGAGIPIGSAYSALHGSHSSQNGNSH